MKKISIALCALIGFVSAAALAQDNVAIQGAVCATPPPLHCPDTECSGAMIINQGPVVEMKTRRTYFLDYPCDLKRGEPVTFILSLHGGGSYGNWQRHYFPLLDYKDKYRLVIATPNSPVRVWSDADDQYLQNIVEFIVAQIGGQNIKAFWLVGHSQGGLTSNRILRTDFFKNKVDGFVSLSGGRVGAPPPATTAANASTFIPTSALQCDFSHIFAIGELEASSASAVDTSEWATKYGCGKRVRKEDVVDEKRGYVTATDQSRGPSWGTTARPGTAQVYEFTGCKDNRVVVDVVRMNKGHTEGLEPNIMERIVKYMLSAKGGKLQKS